MDDFQKEVMALAQAELGKEKLAQAVAAQKEKLKKGTFWTRLFPWRIRIVRADTPLTMTVSRDEFRHLQACYNERLLNDMGLFYDDKACIKYDGLLYRGPDGYYQNGKRVSR